MSEIGYIDDGRDRDSNGTSSVQYQTMLQGQKNIKKT